MKIILGADHAGFEMKEALRPWVAELGHEVVDTGAYVYNEGDDYPDFVVPFVDELLNAEAKLTQVGGSLTSAGIFCAGSGEGEAIAANRHKGVRAAVYNAHDLEVIKRTRTDNNANVLCIGSRFVDLEQAKSAIETFLVTPFDPESRHARRLKKIDP